MRDPIFTFDHPLPLDLRGDEAFLGESEADDFLGSEAMWETMAFGRKRAAAPTEGGLVW